MPIVVETALLALLAYAVGVMAGWLVWSRDPTADFDEKEEDEL